MPAVAISISSIDKILFIDFIRILFDFLFAGWNLTYPHTGVLTIFFMFGFIMIIISFQKNICLIVMDNQPALF